MLRLVCGAACVLAFSQVALACDGDLQGYWEKRPVGSAQAFDVIEAFRIDTATGILSICDSDQSFSAEFKQQGDTMSFGYRRRMRTLSDDGTGVFLTGIWQSEFQGKASDYRIRVTR